MADNIEYLIANDLLNGPLEYFPWEVVEGLRERQDGFTKQELGALADTAYGFPLAEAQLDGLICELQAMKLIREEIGSGPKTYVITAEHESNEKERP
jgi:hypothetical protein